MKNNSVEKMIAEVKADEALIGTPAYQGIAYFWSHEYKHLLRGSSPAAKVKIHNEFIARGLPLDGKSFAHARIVLKNEDSPR